METEATGPEPMSVELEGMADLIYAELLAQEWDPVEETEYEVEWLPTELLEEAKSTEPESVAEPLVAVPLRWRLDLLMVVSDRVDSLVDEK